VEPLDVGAFLQEHRDKEFVKRILYKDKYPVIENDDGSVSTHRMAAEKMEDGRWIVFPTIVNAKEGLVNLPVREDGFPEEAWRYALQNQEYIEFEDGEEAQWFAKGGYKALWDEEQNKDAPP
jgi:hypothetical protein